MKSPRKQETEEQYQAFKTAKVVAGEDLTEFKLEDETILREFDAWLIIENRFPYDAMTSVNHLLIPRDQHGDFYSLPAAMQDEYHQIRRLLAEEQFYDAVVENFPRSQSVTRHTHAHLVRWAYTKEDGSNKSEPTLN